MGACCVPRVVLHCLQGVTKFMSHSHFIVFLSLGHTRNWRLRNKISLPKFTQLVNDKIGIRAHLLSLMTILSTEKCKMAEFEPKTSDLEGIFLVFTMPDIVL